MKTLIIILLLIPTLSLAKDKITTTYDKNLNKTGYRVTKDNKTSTNYDKNWNKTGYEKRDSGTTTTYDKNWNKTGYEKDNSGKR